IVLDGKVSLLLWGSLPELYQHLFLFLLESAVTLHHVPTPGIDLDLTLHRGRVFLTNRKDRGETNVRLRFWREEVWDITLEDPDTMIGAEVMPIPNDIAPLVFPGYRPQKDEEPLVLAALYILKGNARLKVEGRTYGALHGPTGGRALFTWKNKE